MVIYSITCTTNNKIYIGQTIVKPTVRKGMHFFQLRRGIHPNSYLQNTFKKYGEPAFVFKILEHCDTIELLNIKEQFYINEYKTLNRLYSFNVRIGGDNQKMTDDHKNKISIALRGNTNGKGNKGTTRIKPKGFKHSEFTKMQIRNTLKGRKLSKEHIENSRIGHYVKVEQYDIQGNFIMEFNSLMEAARKTGANRHIISLCLSGNKKTSGGYKWKRKLLQNENITA